MSKRISSSFLKKLCAFCLLFLFFGISSISAQSFLSKLKNSGTDLPVTFLQKVDKLKKTATQSDFSSDIPPYSEETFYSLLNLYQKKKYALALLKLKQINLKHDGVSLKNHEKLEQLYHFLLVELNFNLGLYAETVKSTRILIEKFPFIDGMSLIFYNLNYALNELGQPLEYTELMTRDTFEELKKFSSSRARNIRILLFEDALKKNKLYQAVDFISNENGNINPSFNFILHQYLSREVVRDQGFLNDLKERITSRSLETAIDIEILNLLIDDQNYAKAEEYIQKLEENSDELSSVSLDNFERAKNEIDRIFSKTPYRIGVLLPFSHKKLKILAKHVIEGINMAMHEVSHSQFNFELVFEDTGGKASLTIQKYKKLVEEDEVIAVIGPLTKGTSLSLEKISKLYRVPVISFSLTEGIGKNSPYLYRFQRSSENAGRAIAAYAVEYLNAKRLAIIYRENQPRILENVSAFWEEVDKRGGQIITINTTNKKQTDYRQLFRELTGGYRFLSNTEAQDENLYDKKGNGKEIDAVYIPMDVLSVKQISEFSKAYDLEHAWILGDHRLNSVLNLTFEKQQKLRFPDTFSDDTGTQEAYFEKHWQYYHQKKPYEKPTSYTVYSYDLIKILHDLLIQRKYNSGPAIKVALDDLVSNSTGDIFKNINIYRLSGDQTVASF